MEQVLAEVKGDDLEQRGARRPNSPRPGLEEVISCVECLRREKWEHFRDRHGDRGQDLVLYSGRRVSGLTLNELARGAGMKEYGRQSSDVPRSACSGQFRLSLRVQS